MQSLESQLFSFLVTVLMGLTVGVLFDSYRTIMGFISPQKVFAYLSDILFWIIITGVVFFMLIVSNWGEVRLYVVLGVTTGLMIYGKLFSTLVRRLLTSVILVWIKLLNCLLRIVKWIWAVVTYPLALTRKIVVIPVGYIGNSLDKTIRAIKNLWKKFSQRRN